MPPTRTASFAWRCSSSPYSPNGVSCDVAIRADPVLGGVHVEFAGAEACRVTFTRIPKIP